MNSAVLAGKRILGRLVGNEAFGHVMGHALRNRVSSRGLTVDTSSPFVSGQVKAALFWGMYEGAESRFIERYLRPDLDTIEFGSSLGFVSSLIRRRLASTARLVCVEANPNLISVLKRTLELNVPGSNTAIVNAAVDYSGGAHTELTLGRDNLGSRVGASQGTTVTVPTVRLQDLLKEYSIGQYTLICDIEGSEAGFIFDEPESLGNCQQLMLELHETEWRGRHLSIDSLRDALISRHNFRLVDSYGRVFVFQR